jgi:OPT oligopeptide transporter protein
MSVPFPLSFSPGLARAHQLGHVQDISLDDFDDPNFDPTASLLEEESPYPEVRAAVANTDDPKMASSTLRAWVLGLIWAVLIPGVNQFFYFRYPSVVISSGRLQ